LDDSAAIPEFGRKIAGRHYRCRPGAYAVIFDKERRVAIVRTSAGSYLPGGGSEPEETPEATLRRETREECGREIEILNRIGEAMDYLGATPDGDGLVKQGVFFEAAFGAISGAPIEADHTLIWLTPTEAESVLSNRSHAWAVRRSLHLKEL
jgi:8-oxo-dGTP diphosphatase